MRKKIFAILVLIGIAIYVFLPKTKADKIEPINSQEKCAAAEGKVEVDSGFEIELGSELEGKIFKFSKKEGSQVEKGEVIAIIENRDIEAKLKVARAELEMSKSKLQEIVSGSRIEEVRSAGAVLDSAIADMEFESSSLSRFRELYNMRAVSKESLEEKERNAKKAQARAKKASEEKLLLEKGPKQETIRLQENTVEMALASVVYYERLLEKSMITTPISGTIIRKYLEAGEGVTKERALAAIADLEKTRINAEVDETDIGIVHVGDSAQVKSDAFSNVVFKGEIEEIANYAGVRNVKPNNQVKNMDMKVVQVKIRLADKTPLKPGMTVDVRIMPKGDHPLLPEKQLIE